MFSDIDWIIRNVPLHQPKAEVLALEGWFRRRPDLSNDQIRTVLASFSAYGGPPLEWFGRQAMCISSDPLLDVFHEWWARDVLLIADERRRSYAMRIPDPKGLVPAVRAKLQNNAKAMTDPKLREVTLTHLALNDRH
jgi:hypothetical protein